MGNTATSIGEVLFTKTQQKVLGLLYGHPNRSYYTNEILRLADVGIGSVKRELKRMEEAGLLLVTVSGNQIHYQANPQCPIFAELVGIARKTFGIADVLRTALQPLKELIECAFIYGSIAKSSDTSGSDIDLMIITEKASYADVMELLIMAEEQLKRSVHPTIYSPKDFRSKLADHNNFITQIMEQPKIMVMGSINDI